MLEILCIIPARSGSKGIIDKNIIDYNGKPLLSWSIIQAKNSKYKMRIIVSTDSEKYKKIAIEYVAEITFLRPPQISEDFLLRGGTLVSERIVKDVSRLEKMFFDKYVLINLFFVMTIMKLIHGPLRA